MQHDIVLKKLNFDLFYPYCKGVGSLRANSCYHAAACDSNKFDMQHDQVLKMLTFDLLIPSPSVVGEGDSACKTFATMSLHLAIRYATQPCSEKV